MKNIIAIFSKDIRSYFSSLIAYIVIAFFLMLCGYFFFNAISLFSMFCMQVAKSQSYQGNLNLTELVLPQLFGTIAIVMLFMIPILTMRSFSEEKKSGTVELLFTYPIKDFEILVGKYLAVTTVFIIMLLPLLLYPVLIKTVGGVVEVKTYLAGLIGLFFMGMSFISLGIFVSALTENQIIAVTVSFGMLLFFWIIGWVSNFVPHSFGVFIMNMSIIEHFKNFAQGLIDTQDILFYGLFIFFFLYTTLRILESRNWRG